jgi:hypothetical protein
METADTVAREQGVTGALFSRKEESRERTPASEHFFVVSLC